MMAHMGPPFFFWETHNAPVGGISNPYLGFPDPWPYQEASKTDPSYVLPASGSGGDVATITPVVQSWALDIQRQVTENFMGELAYTGKQSMHLWAGIEVNPPSYIPGTNPQTGQPYSTLGNVDSRRPYADIGAFKIASPVGRAAFHSLQFTTRYRTRHGLSFTTAYTWSKSLDTRSTYSAGGGMAQDPLCPMDGERGLSEFDRAHVLAISWVYELPTPFKGQAGAGGAFARHLLGGWQTSGLTRLTSGAPFSCMSGTGNSLNGYGMDRCDTVGNWNDIASGRSREQRILQWFNTAAFAVNPIGRVGTSARDLLRGPTQFNTDLALIKNFRISERYGRLQFRSEFFNVFNQVRLGNPDGNASSATFGRIFSAADPRLIQFALKYIW